MLNKNYSENTSKEGLFYLKIIPERGNKWNFFSRAYICNDAGWRRKLSRRYICRTPDCVVFQDLEEQIKLIKEDIKNHPDRDRHNGELELILENGRQIFINDEMRIKRLRK